MSLHQILLIIPQTNLRAQRKRFADPRETSSRQRYDFIGNSSLLLLLVDVRLVVSLSTTSSGPVRTQPSSVWQPGGAPVALSSLLAEEPAKPMTSRSSGVASTGGPLFDD
jgi:hypothetical protein